MANEKPMKQIKARNKPKGRGRASRPELGNAKSITEAIQHTIDKKNLEAAKDLAAYYEMMYDLAHGKGSFQKAGLKDRVMAIRWHIDMAENYLTESYLEEEHDEHPKVEEEAPKEETEVKKTVNGGQSGNLISLDFDG